MDEISKLSPYEETGQTLPSTSFAKQTPTSKPSAEVRRIVGEIGLRYRPTVQTDLEAHAARIALLSCDVADIPPHVLKKAADRWARESKFMPTAAELVDLCKKISAPPASSQIAQLQQHADKLNNHLWVQDSGCLYFVNSRQRADNTIEHFIDRHV